MQPKLKLTGRLLSLDRHSHAWICPMLYSNTSTVHNNISLFSARTVFSTSRIIIVVIRDWLFLNAFSVDLTADRKVECCKTYVRNFKRSGWSISHRALLLELGDYYRRIDATTLTRGYTLSIPILPC